MSRRIETFKIGANSSRILSATPAQAVLRSVRQHSKQKAQDEAHEAGKKKVNVVLSDSTVWHVALGCLARRATKLPYRTDLFKRLESVAPQSNSCTFLAQLASLFEDIVWYPNLA